jgi:hypothetical protein
MKSVEQKHYVMGRMKIICTDDNESPVLVHIKHENKTYCGSLHCAINEAEVDGVSLNLVELNLINEYEIELMEWYDKYHKPS